MEGRTGQGREKERDEEGGRVERGMLGEGEWVEVKRKGVRSLDN